MDLEIKDNYIKRNENNSMIVNLIIPNGVIGIKDSAFFKCYSLRSVSMPESLKFIESAAFNYCFKMTDITIPNGVISIGMFAFHNCTSLKNITIPSSVEFIGNLAFEGCDSLESITIQEGVNNIDFSAFANCLSLKEVSIPKSLKKIESALFAGCTSLSSIKYNGTKEEWNEILKASNWDLNTNNYVIHCIDGNIYKNN